MGDKVFVAFIKQSESQGQKRRRRTEGAKYIRVKGRTEVRKIRLRAGRKTKQMSHSAHQ